MSFSINKSDAVRQAASGRWLEIFDAICPNLKKATKSVGNHVPCPVSGGTDGFRLYSDANDTGGGVSNQHGSFPNGFDLLMWVWNKDFKFVLNEVSNYLNPNSNNWRASFESERTPQEKPRRSEAELMKQRKINRKLWVQSYRLTDKRSELAIKYLKSRGLDVSKLNLAKLSKTIRFNPSMPLWEKVDGGDFVKLGDMPGIICLFSYGDGQPACLHRTYLNNDGGKLTNLAGHVVNNKKITRGCLDRRISGGAIRLGTPTTELHVSEGLETALSVMQAKGVNVWPCANSTLLGLLEPPEGVTKIIVWADKDRRKNGKIAGTDAALKLTERMAEKDIEVITLFPNDPIPENAKSVDWNDVLIKHGEAGFPDYQMNEW